MKKVFLLLSLSCISAFAVFVAGWLVWHYQGLKPELLFELPVESCETLSFGDQVKYPWSWPMDRSLEVTRICREKGFHSELVFNTSQGAFFALNGRKAKRFIPYGFHYVHGTIEFEAADANTIYFYRFRKRYHPIVFQP